MSVLQDKDASACSVQKHFSPLTVACRHFYRYDDVQDLSLDHNTSNPAERRRITEDFGYEHLLLFLLSLCAKTISDFWILPHAALMTGHLKTQRAAALLLVEPKSLPLPMVSAVWLAASKRREALVTPN